MAGRVRLLPIRVRCHMARPVIRRRNPSRRIGIVFPRWIQETTLEKAAMTLSTLLLIILILALVGALPSWPYSRSWGYGPSGLVGVVLVVLLVMALIERAPA